MKRLGLVLIVMALGCGGSSGGTSGGGSVSVDQFPVKYATAICAQNFKCCDASELAGKTMASCVSNTQTVASLLVSPITSSQAKGRSTYNGQAMGACIASISALTCDQWKAGTTNTTSMSSCAGAITPKVANGGACQDGFECTSGNCVGGDDGTITGTPMDGACMPADAASTPIAIGGACTTAAGTCVDGSYCDSVSGTCKAKKAAGDTCDPNGSGDECANTCDATTSKCTCYVGCGVAAPVTTPGTLLSLALLGLAIGGARLHRRRRRQPPLSLR